MKTIPDNQTILLPREISILADVSETKVRGWIKQNKFPTFKINRMSCAYRADVLAFIDSRNPQTIPPNDKGP